jgi:biopolymer transport protein ExbB/TolQ
MEINLVEIWTHMGLPVKLVVAVLTVQAVACIAAIVDRLILLRLSMRRTRKFAGRARKLMESESYGELAEEAKEAKGSHLATYLGAGLETFLERRKQGMSPTRAAEQARRALERRGELVSQDLHRRMNILASTGSTAPFIGLLGTVLGIINAFKMIAATGSGGIGTIGSAIGEALVVTGYGLVVAIPLTLLHSLLQGEARDLTQVLEEQAAGIIARAAEQRQ